MYLKHLQTFFTISLPQIPSVNRMDSFEWAMFQAKIQVNLLSGRKHSLLLLIDMSNVLPD